MLQVKEDNVENSEEETGLDAAEIHTCDGCGEDFSECACADDDY